MATRWTDKRTIYFLSNGYKCESVEPVTVSRHNKEDEKLVVAASPTVVGYNQFMDGVDLNDKIAKLDQSRKAYKWYIFLVHSPVFSKRRRGRPFRIGYARLLDKSYTH